MFKIRKENLNDLYAKISESMGLYIPVKKAGEVNYDVWCEGKEVSLETLKTVRSPKDAFFPQSENMMKFKMEGKNIDIIDVRDEKAPFVLFGVKACDYKAIEVLDKETCPRYLGHYIYDVKCIESPLWMKRRLIAVGHNAISAMVDITNYVLVEMGQL